MDLYAVVLRLVHILAGVFWIGGVVMLAGFIEPTVKATGPEGNKFMQRLAGGNLTMFLTLAGPLNVLAGLLLYLKDSAGLSTAWITSPTGLGFTFGAIFGLAALGVGLFMSRPAVTGLAAIGKEVQGGGKPPTPEQLGRIGKLQEKLSQATVLTALLLTITLIAMASARYL